jgi:hypothetical protein
MFTCGALRYLAHFIWCLVSTSVFVVLMLGAIVLYDRGRNARGVFARSTSRYLRFIRKPVLA